MTARKGMLLAFAAIVAVALNIVLSGDSLKLDAGR